MKKILIVEDDLALLSLLKDIFKGEYEIVAAENGQEGYERAVSEKPDIILLDIIMPKVNGFEMYSNIKKRPQLKDIPVIFLTNVEPNAAFLKKLQHYPPAYYLVKSSCSMAEIADKVKEVLNSK